MQAITLHYNNTTMKNILQHFVLLCMIISLYNCTKEDTIINSSSDSLIQSALSTSTTLAIRGVNWADPNGNEAKGRVVTPSGLSSSSTSTTAATVAGNIATAVLASGGTAVRMPITYSTTSNSSYWPVYQAAINAVVSKGCYVILCYWDSVGGTVTNSSKWNSMWAKVNSIYSSNTKVLYEPLNEPYSLSLTNLKALYTTFISTYSPTSYKLILDGTGYALDVTGIGAAFTNQYLGIHCYWWFWGAYTVWSSAYSTMSGYVGSYASRTIVTEIGVENLRSYDFWWQWQTGAQNDVAFLTGSLAYAKDNSMGTIAWSGVNDIDNYRWYKAYNNLVEINPGVSNMFRWSWGGQSSQWIGVLANGTYKLKNRSSGLYLDSYGLTTSGSSVYQYTLSSSTNQNWELTYVNGYYWLYSISGDLCLDAGSNTASGSAVYQISHTNTSSPAASQQWTLTLAATGYYKLVNRNTGKCLDTGSLTASGSALQQVTSSTSYTQQWSFVQQ
jgi:hypothetical protein